MTVPVWDESLFIDIITRLATTPGPSLHEAPRAAAIVDILRSYDLEPATDEAGNIWLCVNPGPWPESFVYDAHIDVVGAGVASGVKRYPDRLVAPGIADNLTAVTMLIMLAAHMKEHPPSCALTLLFSTGEEGLGNLRGMRQMLVDHNEPPRLFVSWDLGYEIYSVDAVGSHRYELTVTGPGGHSWSDFGTPSANEALVAILQSLKKHYISFSERARLCISYNLGLLEGGTGINCIASNAKGSFEYRSADPVLLDEMDCLIHELVEQHPLPEALDCKLNVLARRPAGSTVLDERLVQKILEVFRRNGIEPVAQVRSTNLNMPLNKRWPGICLGLCKGSNIHRADETLNRASLPIGWSILCGLTDALPDII